MKIRAHRIQISKAKHTDIVTTVVMMVLNKPRDSDAIWGFDSGQRGKRVTTRIGPCQHNSAAYGRKGMNRQVARMPRLSPGGRGGGGEGGRTRGADTDGRTAINGFRARA